MTTTNDPTTFKCNHEYDHDFYYINDVEDKTIWIRFTNELMQERKIRPKFCKKCTHVEWEQVK